MKVTSLLTVASTLASFAAAIPTISITGSKFFTSDGNQFYIKGVAYQLSEFDPLLDGARCEKDAALMQTLGANSIRVYHVNATADHSACMNAFAARGIYLWVDLDSFTTYVGYTGIPNWTVANSNSFRQVMDNFQQYANTAGFFVGNEVVNGLQDSLVASYLLAAKVDLAAYAKAKGYRNIPIGYSSADIVALRPNLQDYMACRPNATERLDFYALNTYEWCGSTTFKNSGYQNLESSALGYPLPIFISETGCNNIRPRTFGEMNSIYGSDMSDTWSGSIVYEWIQEWNDFGLVSYVNQQTTSFGTGFPTGSPTPYLPDFTNLQSIWATNTPSGVKQSAYASTVKTTSRTCPSSSASGWTVNPQAPLPTLNQSLSVTSGLPAGIPVGSITISGTLAASSGSPNSAAASGSATAAKSSAGGIRNMPLSHVFVAENLISHVFTTVAGLSAIAMLLL